MSGSFLPEKKQKPLTPRPRVSDTRSRKLGLSGHVFVGARNDNVSPWCDDAAHLEATHLGINNKITNLIRYARVVYSISI